MSNWMSAFFIFIIALISFRGNTQDSATHSIIQDAIYSRRADLPIYYIDSSLSFYRKFKALTKHGRVEGIADTRTGQKTNMKFSKAELRDIDEQIRLQYSIAWPDLLFPNSVRLTSDSLLDFLNYRTAAQYQKERKDIWYYLFSQPVFIRNNTVAILRLAEMINHSAGNDIIFIYTKIGNRWSRKMTIWAGAW